MPLHFSQLVAILAFAYGIPGLHVGLQNSPPADLETWKTPSLHQYGIDLLKRGRNFERAIAALKLAVQREPTNPDHELALGCAYASRFASVGLAQEQAAEYVFRLKSLAWAKGEWDKGQKDPTSDWYGKPLPAEPPVPATPDDDRAFTASKEEASKTLKELGCNSLAAFDEAGRLAENLPKERQSEVIYARGWALYLIRRYGKGVVLDRPKVSGSRLKSQSSPKDDLIIDQEDVIACFHDCTEADPKNPAAWQSLGLSLIPKILDPYRNGIYPTYDDAAGAYSKRELDVAISALQCARGLKPRDFDLLYQTALIVGHRSPQEGADYLEQVVRKGGTNAVLWYQLAEQRLRLAETKEKENLPAGRLHAQVFEAVRSGNHAPQYRQVPLEIPAPPLLRKAWEYSRLYALGQDPFNVMSISVPTMGLVRRAQLDSCPEETRQRIEAIMQMGLKIMENVKLTSPDPRDPLEFKRWKMRALMGVVSCHAAYGALKEIYRAKPDPLYVQLLKEYGEMIPAIQEFDEATTRVP